jgi:hypothetical protein
MSRVADAFMDPELAVIMLAPTVTPVAMPFAPTNATLVLEDVQCTEVVRLLELPSLNLPVAVNCWLDPTPTDIDAGVTASEVSVAEFPAEPELDLPPQAIRVTNKSITIKAYVRFTSFSNADVKVDQGMMEQKAADEYCASAQFSAGKFSS